MLPAMDVDAGSEIEHALRRALRDREIDSLP